MADALIDDAHGFVPHVGTDFDDSAAFTWEEFFGEPAPIGDITGDDIFGDEVGFGFDGWVDDVGDEGVFALV